MPPLLTRFDVRIAIIYALSASVWIITSDTLVTSLVGNDSRLAEIINTFKGLGFVVVTTALLFLLLRRELLLRLVKESALESEIQSARNYHAELKNSEMRFRKAVEEAPLPILIFAEDGEVLSISRTWLDVTGYTAEQLKTLDSWTELAYGERKQTVRAQINRLFDFISRVDEGEFTIRCADGAQRIWAFSSTPLGRYSDGRRVAISIASDVTQQQQHSQVLREKEEMLRLFIEQAPVALAMFDQEMHYLAVSRRWMTDYGLGERDIIGESHYEVFPEIPERWKGVHRSGMAGIVQQAEDDPFSREDGSTQWLNWKVHPWHTGEGEIGGIVIFTEDVTERKRVQDALRESEHRFSRIFHVSPVPTVLTHLPDGLFVDVNEAMERLTGRSREELRGKTSLELGLYVDPDVRSQLAERMKRTGSYRNMDAQLRDKSGGIHSLLLSSELIELGGDQYAITMVHDITEHRQAEVALRESEERYRLLINSLTDYAVFTLDVEGFVTSWNSGAERIIGFRPEEIIGTHVSVLYTAEDTAAGRPEQFMKRVVEEGSFRDEEWRVRKDGTLFWAEVYMVCIRDETGQLHGFSRVTRDLTERKEAEEHIRYLANLIESVSDAIISTDSDFVIRSWNKAAEALFGWTASEVIGKPLDEIVPTQYPDNNGAEVLAEFRNAGSWRGEVIQMHRDGTPIDILSSVSLAFDGNRRLVGVVGINRDIRERKSAEKALQLLNQRLVALRQIDNDIIQARSPDGITETVLRHIRQLIPCERASVTLFEEQEGTAVIYSVDSADSTSFQPQLRVPFIRNRSVEMLETGHVLMIPDLQKLEGTTSEFAQRAIAEGIRATLSAPLLIQGRLIGHLSLASKTPDFFTAEHSSIASEIANQLSIALYNARLLQTIQNNNDQLKNFSARVVEAQEIERGHIARELHDEVGQTLTALSLMLSVPQRKHAASERQPDLEQAKLLLSDLTRRIRELSLDLRPSMLDDLGLIPTLIWFLDRYQQQTGIIIDFRYSEVERRFAAVIETTLYRIIQEALTNVARHAQVDHASVRLWATVDAIHAQIEDAGTGFDADSERQTHRTGGLTGLRERAQLAGGTCEILSNVGEGTLVSVTIPLEFGTVKE